MPTHDIGIWFLLLSLLFPRITLFFWWICGNLPFNTTPFVGDLFATIFLPRLLVIVWIYDLQGMSAWFWVHLVIMLVVWGFSFLRFAARKSS